MPQVSRYKLHAKVQNELVDNLNTVFSAIAKREEMLTFLDALLTNTERIMLAKRLAMIILIAEGLPDGKIATALHVTRMTVMKMRYFYESRGREGFAIALQKIEADKKLVAFKRFLLSLAAYSIRAAGGYVKPIGFK